MDTRRTVALARGQAIDHQGAVVESVDPDFSLEPTIFAIVAKQSPFFIAEMLRRQLARVPHWADAALSAFRSETVPAAPPIDTRITDFMLNECNFKMEHADGSFMDHVAFCHDYCAAYYKGHSPRVLLLHSILGVGTNIFPMEVGKLSQLSALVNETEMRHIEAFPSVLRLLVGSRLLADLRERLGDMDKLKQVSFRRVIDNKPLELDADDFWVQLNYQVIHLIDFLPVAEWAARVSEPLFQVFLELRTLLGAANQLQAKVDIGATCVAPPVEAQLLSSAASSPMGIIKRSQAKTSVRKFSAQIGHSLDYTLHWKD
uniref:Uncharacterized protein n=1 Tax=Zooxanthella nutricula TaxID=1333877 RepID=A0A7S2QJ34_9DINO